MRIAARYPTDAHRDAASAVTDFSSGCSQAEALILYGSCARGRATRDSCLDFMLLVPPDVPSAERARLLKEWGEFYAGAEVFDRLRRTGRFSHVDFSIIDGRFRRGGHGWTTGPDSFELEIGNTLVYSVPLHRKGGRFDALRSEWLPYYPDGLRSRRLEMVRRYCVNNLEHIPLYVERELYFQAFRRLYNAFGEFLQALFIRRRLYPIAYDKWLREQFEEVLCEPDLYRRAKSILEVSDLEGDSIAEHAETLRELLEEYA